MFPEGGPGVALIILRLSVAAALIVTTLSRSGSSSFVFAGAALVSLALGAGFLTPFMAAIVCLFAIVNLFVGHPDGFTYLYIFSILDGAALAILGPGAYSIDARLYGRRVTVVTPRKNPN